MGTRYEDQPPELWAGPESLDPTPVWKQFALIGLFLVVGLVLVGGVAAFAAAPQIVAPPAMVPGERLVLSTGALPPVVTGFGVRTAYGTLERVLVHRPGRELDEVTPETLREFHFARRRGRRSPSERGGRRIRATPSVPSSPRSPAPPSGTSLPAKGRRAARSSSTRTALRAIAPIAGSTDILSR